MHAKEDSNIPETNATTPESMEVNSSTAGGYQLVSNIISNIASNIVIDSVSNIVKHLPPKYTCNYSFKCCSNIVFMFVKSS